jgi:hypothetical protein
MQRLQQTPAERQKLKKGDFDLTNGASGERSLIAEHKVKTPTFFRPDAAGRLVFATVEEFQTDGTADNTETFNLSHNLIETPNASNLVLHKNGNIVQPDSVDYSADSFDFTDAGTGNYLHAAYVPRDPVLIEIERQAPRAQGGVNDIVLDEPTSLLHEQDQNQDPPEFIGSDPLDYAVPRNWKVQIYADGPVPLEWNDDAEANSQGAVAENAVVSLPVRRATEDVEGLSQAVKRHII